MELGQCRRYRALLLEEELSNSDVGQLFCLYYSFILQFRLTSAHNTSCLSQYGNIFDKI